MLVELNNYAKKETVIVKSNHDEFLDRWLEDGKYIKDPINFKLGHILAIAKYDGIDPLKFYFESGHDTYIKFLKKDESFEIAQVQLGAHGNEGANGARGSLDAMEKSFKNSISAHTHHMRIVRGAWSVGTSTFLRIGYNTGSSSWTNTSALLYPNGMRQLISVIDGRWR